MSAMHLKFAFEPTIGGVWGEEPNGDVNDMVCVRVADFDDVACRVSPTKLTTRNISPSEQRGRVLKNGDLLLEKSGGGEQTAVGRTVLFDHEFKSVCSNFVALLRPHKAHEPRFLAYLSRAIYLAGGSIPHIKQTTGIQNLDCSSYLSQSVEVPEISKQRLIAAYLDEQTGKIDRLMTMRRRQMVLLKEQRAALIQQAVTRGLNPNVPMKDSGLPWLGEVPAHWAVNKIKHHCLVKRGASPRPIDDPRYFDDNGEYSWVRISDVTASDKYLTTSEQRLSELGASLSVKREPGDIFVSICASVGKPIITQIKCCIHDGFVWFERLKLEPEYLYQLFTSGEMFKGLGNWGTQLNLNTDIIGDIKIPIPPESEQRRIAEHLDKNAVEFDRILSAYARQLEVLTEYRAALIHECVTGQRAVPEVASA